MVSIIWLLIAGLINLLMSAGMMTVFYLALTRKLENDGFLNRKDLDSFSKDYYTREEIDSKMLMLKDLVVSEEKFTLTIKTISDNIQLIFDNIKEIKDKVNFLK